MPGRSDMEIGSGLGELVMPSRSLKAEFRRLSLYRLCLDPRAKTLCGSCVGPAV